MCVYMYATTDLKLQMQEQAVLLRHKRNFKLETLPGRSFHSAVAQSV